MSVIYLNVDKVLYNQISVLLPDIWPNIKINLLVADENLEKLGFCKSAPCLMTIDLSENEYEQLLDELLQLEIDAYNTPDGRVPSDKDPNYIRYRKYGWMWDVLYRAETQAE